jgi:hypothetical protein
LTRFRGNILLCGGHSDPYQTQILKIRIMALMIILLLSGLKEISAQCHFNLTFSEISCHGGTSTVSIVPYVPGSYVYTFGTEANNTGVFEGIRAGGPYTWYVTDGDTCNHSGEPVTITEPDEIQPPLITGLVEACLTGSFEYVTLAGMTGYTWSVQGGNILSGTETNSIVVNWNATGQHTITVNYTDLKGCTSGTPGTYVVTVNPSVQPTISISTPFATICQGTAVTFTATIQNGGASPNYQWKVNGINTGDNSNIFLTSALNNNDQVSAELISSAACPLSPVVSSNIITMTVNSTRIPTIAINESENPVCSGQPVTFTATDIIEGGLNPAFQWTVNGTPAGSNSPIFTSSSLNDNDQVQVMMTSSVACSVNPAISNMIVIDVNPVPILSNVPGDHVYCSGELTSSMTLSGEPSGVIFDITGAGSIGLADQVSVIAIPSFTTVSGHALVTIIPHTNSCIGLPVSFNITVNPEPAAESPGNQVYCDGVTTAPVNLTGVPVSVLFDISGGGLVGLPDQTGVNSIPSFIPITGNAVVTIIPKANNCTGSPVSFNITVNPVPVANIPADQTYCNGVQTSSLPLTGSPGGVVFDISGGASVGLADRTSVISIPAFTPITGNATIIITPRTNNCVGQSVPFHITVNPTPSVNTVANQTFCNGTLTTPVPLSGSSPGTIFDITGGTSIGLQNQTGVNAIPAFMPATGTSTITIIPRANGCTGNPFNLTIAVNPNIPVSTSITANSNPVCANTPVIFTASSVNGGTNPSYQWYVNGIPRGSNSPGFTYTPLNGDRISATLNSSLSCTSGNPAQSNTLIMTVFTGPPATPSVPIPRDGQANSICPVATGLEYHIPASDGALTYIWNFPQGWTIINGQGSTTVSVTAGIQSIGNKNITVTAVNPCGTVTSQPLIVTVGTYGLVNAGQDQTVCAGTSSVRLNGTITGAIGNNDWNWSAPSGTFSPNNKRLDAYYNIPGSISSGGSIVITMTARTEGTCQILPDQMTVTVRPDPIASIQVSGDNPVCSNSTSSLLIASTANTNVTYRINGGPAQTVFVGSSGSVIINTDPLSTTSTWSLESAGYSQSPECTKIISGTVTITVNPRATVSAGADQVVCATDPSVNLGGSVGGIASSGTWTGGSGTFSPGRASLNAVYFPSANEITTGSFLLTLTTNDPDGPCNPVSDDILITINTEPAVNAGANQVICAGSTVILNGSVGGSASSGTWSGGSGTFSPGRGSLNAIYTPGQADISAGHVILTLTSNDPPGPCIPAVSQIDITISSAVIVNAGADQILCAGSTVSLSGIITGGSDSGSWSGGSGTFANSGLLNTVYTPGSADRAAGFVILTLTSSDPEGPCPAVSDQLRITLNTQPIVDAGQDEVICAGSSVTLRGTVGGSAFSGAWSGGSGVFTPDASSLNTVYLPSPAEINSGTAILILTTNDPAGVCTAVSDQINIVINAQATVNAGSNQTICSNSSAQLSGAAGGGALSGVWSGGTGTFSPDRNTLNAIYTPSIAERNAGSVTLTLTTNDPAGPCGPASSTTTITIRRAIQITTQPLNVGVCASFPARFDVTATGDQLTYQWYKNGIAVANSGSISGANTQSLQFSQVRLEDAGNYYVIVSGSTQCTPATSATVSLNVDQAIIITSQPGSLITCTGTATEFIVSANANGDPLTYQWRKNGANISGATSSSFRLNNITGADAGRYDVVISGTAGYMCSSVNSTPALLTVTPDVGIPVFSSGVSSSRCQGSGTATYNASASNSAGIIYSIDAASAAGGNEIDPVTGTVTFNGSWTGTIVVTATAAGCNGPASAVHTVTVSPTVSAPLFNLGRTSSICQGSGIISYTAIALNSTGITYSLDAASITGGNTINPSTGAVNFATGWAGISLITASANGCNGPVNSTHTVTITPTVGRPVFAAGMTSTRCQGIGTVDYTASASNSTLITYSLDAASLAGGNIINSTTGRVTYSSGWTGTTIITANAAGCNGPLSSSHTVSVTPSTESPVFSIGSASSRCQSAETIIYHASANNSTGITYSLDLSSTSAGNIINSLTGAVTFTASWNGTSVITASAAGCGPLTSTHTVTTFGLSSGGSVTPSNSIICFGSDAGTLTLTGYYGDIRNWEYSTDAGVTWTSVSNTSAVYRPVISRSAIFRAVVQNGNCPVAYSSPAFISVIPLRDPVIISRPQPPVICAGQQVILTANSGPMDGTFINGSFNDANPVGWCRDHICTGDYLPAHRDNETSGPWGETNGPKEFSGIIYSSNSGKFAVTGGNLTSTLETPVFSLFGNPPATLYWRDAYYLLNGATARIEISTNGGSTYTQLGQLTGQSGNYQSFIQEQIDISQYIGQTNLRIRFTFNGTAGSSWAIDEVRVTPAGIPPSLDYTWASNPGTWTTRGDSIIVSPPITTSYTLTTSITTPYGTCPLGSGTIIVTVNPLPVCEITGQDSPVCTDTQISYSAPAGMKRYSWRINGNGSILSGSSDQNVIVRSGPVCNSGFTLSLTVTDNNDCVSTCTRTIIVNDTIPPVISGCPAEQVFCETQGHSYEVPVITGLSDNCNGSFSVTYLISGATTRNGSGNNASGLFNNGNSVITWSVADHCGNIATCTTNVIINPIPLTSPIYHR